MRAVFLQGPGQLAEPKEGVRLVGQEVKATQLPLPRPWTVPAFTKLHVAS